MQPWERVILCVSGCKKAVAESFRRSLAVRRAAAQAHLQNTNATSAPHQDQLTLAGTVPLLQLLLQFFLFFTKIIWLKTQVN